MGSEAPDDDQVTFSAIEDYVRAHLPTERRYDGHADSARLALVDFLRVMDSWRAWQQAIAATPE